MLFISLSLCKFGGAIGTRRGILTHMISYQIDGIHERGEPLASCSQKGTVATGFLAYQCLGCKGRRTVAVVPWFGPLLAMPRRRDWSVHWIPAFAGMTGVSGMAGVFGNDGGILVI